APVNARNRSGEICHILEDSGARALVTQAGSIAAGEAARLPPTDTLQHRIVIGRSDDAPGAGEVGFDRLLESGSLERARPGDTDTAILLYTSGTTGPSKGVELS